MIQYLHIHQFRNLHQVSLQVGDCNVIFGENGSGKTSLLEAIYVLSHGKSFRHAQPKRYIQHQNDITAIFARLDNLDEIAIQKKIDATTILRYNQETLYTQSPLTKKLPMLIIDPSSIDVLEQGSNGRRQLLDWIAFHVKHDFHQQWLSYQRLLRHRNLLLKQTLSLSNLQKKELESWDWQLSHHAKWIHQYRQEVFTQWHDMFVETLSVLLPHYSQYIRLFYQAGYDINHDLNDLLQQRLNQDLQLGYTRIGSHRADISVQWMVKEESKERENHHIIKEQATNVLSRGEKKLLVTALRLSQLQVLMANYAKFKPIVLLDDVTAELDGQAIDLLLSTLSQANCQIFITSLTEDVIEIVKNYWHYPNMFHVKQGEIRSWNGSF